MQAVIQGCIIKTMANTINNNNQVDIDQELAVADFGGRKLGLLIASLPADDEVKEAFLVLAENSSYDELIQLEEILESLYLSAQTSDLDEQFKKDLEALKLEIDADEEKTNSEFLAKLEKIEALIKV